MRLIRKPFRPRRSPILALKLNSPKYESWGVWLNGKSEIGGIKTAKSLFRDNADDLNEPRNKNVEQIRAG